MRIAVYANTVSPHQMPLARELVGRLGEDGYRYIYTDELTSERMKLGWFKADERWIVPYASDEAKEWLENADVVFMQHNRDWDLLERRLAAGKVCLYASERWFKPNLGMLRLLHPKYFKMAWRFVRMFKGSEKLLYLPIGVHAARDMARLCGLFSGDWKCLFRAPKVEFERKPCGMIRGGALPGKMRMWGYFVEQGTGGKSCRTGTKVLWVGRLLKLKLVDIIVRAVGECAKTTSITLDIYGTGPEEMRLKKLAAKYCDAIKFHGPVHIEEVRRLMREHDVYVLASNGYEGWGAVVSEALEEGMKVIGTYEAGSSATILPDENLFHAGDKCALANLLSKADELPFVDYTLWRVPAVAEKLLEALKDL